MPDPQHCCAATVYGTLDSGYEGESPLPPCKRNHQAERREVRHRGGAREGGGH
jgi:hypothetical protein